MSETTDQTLIDSLDQVLEQEQQALLEGDFEEILRLAKAKEALIDTLNATRTHDGARFEGLHRKVLRNQSLLDGTLQGIRQVAARVATLRRLRKTLETYDSEGRKQNIDGEIAHRMEKRA